MPKSENSSSLMLQCSFTCPLTGKKCLNQSDCNSRTTSASAYCSSHLILKCSNKKDVDLNQIQSNLEEQSSRLIRRLRHLQGDQLRDHINRQLSAFVRHQQQQLNFTCQHPQFISRDHYSFDKNLVLSTLQQSQNIHSNSISSIKNLPTSQIVKLVKKSQQQQQQQQQQDSNQQHLLHQQLQQPPLAANHLQPINCLQNNNLHNLQPPVASPIGSSHKVAAAVAHGEPPIKQQPYQISNPVLNHIHIKEEPNPQLTISHFSQFNQFVQFSPIQQNQQINPIAQLNQINQINQLNQINQINSVTVKDENKNQRKSLNYASSSSPTKLNSSSSSIVVNRKPLAPKFTSDQIKQINTTTGILRSNLKHFEHSYDSDATDSSSGGESCDELDDYVSDYVNDLCKQEKLDLNSVTPLPLYQKSNWKWASERGAIACRWAWLEAQIGDLDFKIRQQNELYKQFRASKGQISFYSTEPIPPISASDAAPATEQYSSCIRTLPLKEMKKRKLVRSAFILANTKATSNDVKPNVLCSCSSLPAFANSCVLCNDRYNFVQAIDTNCMPVAERVALLDAAYHIVTSLPENVSLGLHFSKLLKKEIVSRPVVRNTISKKKKICPKGELGLKYKNDLGKKKKSQALIQSTKLKKKYEGNNKKQLLNKKANKVRLSKVSKDRADSLQGYADENSRHDSPLPFVENGSATRDSLSAFNRRRRSEQSNAYDINNIVIPYSIASTTRVERLQYKEIITPEWRVTEEDEENAGENVGENHMEVEVKQEPLSPGHHHNNSSSKLPALPALPASPVCKSPSKLPPLNRSSSTLNKLLLNSLSSPEKMDTSEIPAATSSPRTSPPPPPPPLPAFKLEPLDSPSLVDNLLNCRGLNNKPDDTAIVANSLTENNLNNSLKPDDEDSNMSASTDLSEEHKSDSLEDLSDETFIERHLKCEADEKKRFSTYLKNPLGVGSRGSRIRQRTESTKSETMQLEPSTIDGSSQDSFSNMQIHSLSNSTPHAEKAKSPDSLVFEEGSNQSTTNKIRSYSLSSRRDELSIEEENYVEMIPYERRNFPLNDNELNQLTMYLDNND